MNSFNPICLNVVKDADKIYQGILPTNCAIVASFSSSLGLSIHFRSCRDDQRPDEAGYPEHPQRPRRTQPIHVSLALQCIANIADPEMARPTAMMSRVSWPQGEIVCVSVCVCHKGKTKVPDEWQAWQVTPAMLQVNRWKHNKENCNNSRMSISSIDHCLPYRKREAIY